MATEKWLDRHNEDYDMFSQLAAEYRKTLASASSGGLGG